MIGESAEAFYVADIWQTASAAVGKGLLLGGAVLGGFAIEADFGARWLCRDER